MAAKPLCRGNLTYGKNKLLGIVLTSTKDYYLENIVGEITKQLKVPFGDAVISTLDTCIGAETCEEVGSHRFQSTSLVD